jgi:hypothetical protein
VEVAAIEVTRSDARSDPRCDQQGPQTRPEVTRSDTRSDAKWHQKRQEFIIFLLLELAQETFDFCMRRLAVNFWLKLRLLAPPVASHVAARWI